jgi:3-methyladenine DNA glycosylase/8-oxoguanine DNA glycosylase
MFKKIIEKQKEANKSKKRAELITKLAEAEKNGDVESIKKILEQLSK